MRLFGKTNRGVTQAFIAEIVLGDLLRGVVIVDEQFDVVYADQKAAEVLNLNLDQLLQKDARTNISQWQDISAGWPRSTPSLLDRFKNPFELESGGKIFQAPLKEYKENSRRYLAITFLDYTKEDVLRKELIELRNKLDRSQEAAINIMADLDSQRRFLKEANEQLAWELVAKKQVEKELSKHKSELELMVSERTAALGDSKKQLLAKDKLASLGTLAAGIAHEINNPIGAIGLTIDNAAEQLSLITNFDELRLYVGRTFDKVRSQAKRCGLIVRGILQFARAEPTEKWPNDLNEVVRTALANLNDSLVDRTNKIEFLPEVNLPVIKLNPTAMQQVVINIVKNALEAGTGRPTKVTVSTALRAGTALLVINDTGPGMTEEQKRHIFDPFFTTRLNGGGTGLGMSIVHGIVTEHGADISIQSVLGAGTVMTIQFPTE